MKIERLVSFLKTRYEKYWEWEKGYLLYTHAVFGVAELVWFSFSQYKIWSFCSFVLLHHIALIFQWSFDSDARPCSPSLSEKYDLERER